MRKTSKPVCGKPANLIAENQQTITETTSKTTSQTTFIKRNKLTVGGNSVSEDSLRNDDKKLNEGTINTPKVLINKHSEDISLVSRPFNKGLKCLYTVKDNKLTEDQKQLVKESLKQPIQINDGNRLVGKSLYAFITSVFSSFDKLIVWTDYKHKEANEKWLDKKSSNLPEYEMKNRLFTYYKARIANNDLFDPELFWASTINGIIQGKIVYTVAKASPPIAQPVITMPVNAPVNPLHATIYKQAG